MPLLSSDSMPGAGHALRFTGAVNNIHEAPAIGNGDLGVLVQVFQNEFRLHLAKNDIWDARFDHVAKDWMVTQDNLIRMTRDYGFRLEGGAYSGKPVFDRKPPRGLRYIDHGPGWERHVFPCPKPAGLIRVLHSGISSTRIDTTVDIRTGIVTAEFLMDFDWHGKGRLRIEAFVDRVSNAIRIRIHQDQLLGAFRLCVEKAPDGLDATLPDPRVRRLDDWHGTVSQRIPGGYGVRPFTWHLACAFPLPGKGRAVQPITAHRYRLWQECELQPGTTAEFMVGVATDRDGSGDCLTRARRAAGEATPECFHRARTTHMKAWHAFWMRSAIELEDKELEKTWYRNLFALACQIGPRAMAPGLCGNVVPWDASPWHGGYTVNMNIQKMFLASVPTHHPEWIDAYAGWLDHMRPGFRHLAKITFGLEGLYSPHMIFPYVPAARQASSNQCGRALGMIGWHGQPLWWRWEYLRDRRFLRERAYPYFKATACFYWRYLRKYFDASGDLYPSLNLEGPPWTKDFQHNRDCFIDLILFRNTFRYAIEASRVLRVDGGWRKRWEWGLSKIRPIRVTRMQDDSFWIHGDKNDEPPADADSRHERAVRGGQAVTAAWTVFPGEYVQGDETEGLAPALRDIMQRTRWSELHPAVIWIHHWWCAIPALRMGLPDAFALARKVILRERFPAGHARTTHWIHLLPDSWRVPEDNYLGVAATTEIVLQSQGAVIRLFPAWPRGKAARFRDLPARGGFLVSASWHPRKGLQARIRSLAGTDCRVRWQAIRLPRVTCHGAPMAVRRVARDFVFPTRAGAEYEFHSRA